MAGFRLSDAGNRAVLVNCKSIGNKYGYYADSTTQGMKLIDCSVKNCQIQKSGNVTTANTEIVE